MQQTNHLPTVQEGKINVIIDLQWGSTGKGVISRYLAEKDDIDLAICNFSPNSAHTSVEDDGTEYIFKQMPQPAALVDRGADIDLWIGADACINIDVLTAELEKYPNCAKKLRIHPNASIITEDCIEYERQNLVRISSTLQGTSAARAMKIMRKPEVVLAKDHPYTKEFVLQSMNENLIVSLAKGAKVLGDFHQGYELSVNSSFYPYCTSSTVNTAQFLASFNMPPSALGSVVGTVRTYPIRVGNVKNDAGEQIGYSGDVYADMEEYTWDQITEMSGSPSPLLEHTTLTKKVRRIFSFSHFAVRRAATVNDVSHLFINFVNYLDHSVYGESDKDKVMGNAKIKEFVESVQNKCAVKVAYLGTGPKNSHVIDLTQ